jgi:CUE domain
MDDDDVQDAGVLGDNTTTTTTTQPTLTNSSTAAPGKPPAPTVEDETPPTKPPRPQTEAQKNEGILKEAFPSVDASVIKAILRASGGKVEPAFNALLGR